MGRTWMEKVDCISSSTVSPSMGEHWKEEMFTLKHYIKVGVIQDGRPTVQASPLVLPTSPQPKRACLMAERQAERKKIACVSFGFPQAKCKVRLLLQKQEYLFQRRGGTKILQCHNHLTHHTSHHLTVCPDISTLVYLSVYWYVVLEWRDSMEKSPNLW